MLKIKLARFGKRSQPHYRVVVNEARDKRDGKYVEAIGTYAPTQTPKILTIDTERFNYWVKQGAQPTDTVANLFARFQTGTPFPAKKARPSKKTIAKQLAAKEAAAKPADVTAEPVAEPAVEEVTETVAEPTAETTSTAEAK